MTDLDRFQAAWDAAISEGGPSRWAAALMATYAPDDWPMMAGRYMGAGVDALDAGLAWVEVAGRCAGDGRGALAVRILRAVRRGCLSLGRPCSSRVMGAATAALARVQGAMPPFGRVA